MAKNNNLKAVFWILGLFAGCICAVFLAEDQEESQRDMKEINHR